MSTPERTHTNGNSASRLPDGPIAPPQNLEAEQSVLGAVLLSDTALPALIIDERLHPEDFYREAHAIVFTAMLDLHNGGEPVDALTLVEHLKQAGQLEAAGGRSAIDLLASSVPAVGHLRQYARIVRENAMLRRLLRAAYDIQERVHSHDAPPRELVDIAERLILEVAHEDSRKDFHAINDVLDVEITKLEQLSREGKAITGTPSGFEDLDNITGGFQPGQPDHPGRAPVDGQVRADGQLRRVRRAQLRTRPWRCSRSRCPSPSSRSASSRRRRRSRATTCARGACRRRAGSRSSRRRTGSRSRRCSSTTRPTSRCSTCARRRAGCSSSTPTGSGLILIDYLQLMRGDGRTDSRVEQIGQISRGLKTLARELDCPVIALSQLNRGVEQRTEKRPLLSDLRESGSIEQDADLVMFIYRDEYYDKETEREGIADVIISKHRNGGLGDVELTFQKEYPRFMSYVGDDRY